MASAVIENALKSGSNPLHFNWLVLLEKKFAQKNTHFWILPFSNS